MRITAVETWGERVPLSRPYAIASRTIDAVELLFVELRDGEGRRGFGSASPSEDVTGESVAACRAALGSDVVRELVGRDLRELGNRTRKVSRALRDTPAARAAVDMALLDLFARALGVPLVDYLGRCHEALPTSITVGIKETLAETLTEAEEYVERGFRSLKIKIGRDLDEDAERLIRLRESVGPGVAIRVDANRGYGEGDLPRLVTLAEDLGLELVEQPLPRGEEDALRRLPAAARDRIALDESLLHLTDAVASRDACGIFNVKLMKCGGVTPALAIAEAASAADRRMMWGCNDESAVGIAAALHAAYASPATRYLDLDGSFDLARDPFQGGFRLRDGLLYLLDLPGLGVERRG